MNERLVMIPIDLVDPTNTNALGDNEYYINVPFDCYIVYVSAGSDTDDADLTLDINDDGSGVITEIDCADKEDPGEWISTHFGGSNDPVKVDADSELSFDANDATAATTIKGYMLVLSSDVYA